MSNPRFGTNRGYGYNDDTLINNRIRAPKVRLVDEEGNQVGVVDINTALAKAAESGLDLVEVAANVNPPVCRIMDYSKYKYEQKKKKKIAKKKQHVTHTKEMRFKPKIEEHDYQVKVKHIKDFLEKKDKVRILLRFRGREIAHKELGRQLLNRVAADMSALGEMDAPPKEMGKSMMMTLIPKTITSSLGTTEEKE
ncbi:MAG: translation initiation factor IF-3 [Candidatus Omnitrophota bacterium]